MNIPVQTAPVPTHVPPELVRNWALAPHAPSAEDPYEVIIPRIHEEPPAFYAADGQPNTGSGCWVFRQASVLREVYGTPELFSSSQTAQISALMGESWDQIPLEIDAPEHQFYRMLLNPLFTPKKLATFEQSVRQHARHFAQKMASKGEGDFVAEFTQRFPIAVFLDLVGFPFEQVDTYLAYEHDIISNPDIAAKQRSAMAVKTILLDAIAARRKNPGDDIISYFIQAELDGRRLTPDEVLHTSYTFYLGGLDTVTSILGWIFRYLARHPAQQARLRDNPDFMPTAMEELIRAFGVASMYRRVTTDADFHGVHMKRGDLVMVSTSLACRDPEAFENPGVIDFDRPSTRHLTFASGPHICIGMHLARREILIALQEVIGALKNFRLKDGQDATWHLGNVLGLNAMQLEWDL